MTDHETPTEATQTARVAAAIRAGDESAFTALVDRYRRELLLHSYRMLGSFHDAEDAVQETFLRAWRYRDSLQEGSPLRPWLYRVATNACLDAIGRDRKRTSVADGAGADAPQDLAEVSWLQPFPDALLEPAAPHESEPDAVALTKETIELTFPGDTAYRAMALDVLRIEEGLITEIVTFAPEVFAAFGLPRTLSSPD